MKNPLLNTLAAICTALPLVFVVYGPATAQVSTGCISGREAQQFVEARRILSLDRALQAAGVAANRIISRGAEVCDIDGSPYYRVNIMDEYGDSKPIDLPAQGE